MKLALRLFPPSWVQIVSDDVVVYIDPAYLSTYFAKHPGRVEFSKWPDEIDGLPEPELPRADIVLLTHAHKDHCKRVTIDRLCGKDTVILGPKRCARPVGRPMTIVSPGDEIGIRGIRLRALPAYNTATGSSTKKAHPPGRGVGYLVTIGDTRIYHAGDTDLIPEMKDLSRVDVAFFPVGGTFTMDIDEAIEAALVIKPMVAVPMHHLRRANPDEFVARLRKRSRTVKPNAPGIGEVISTG
jgi:L-ascorbate metabolism protein UlaG (beta-lactamase superfamily)